ncbi:2-C-methyl-D-erythritol 4-phosphate cytidylyltransferase [Corynebacterium freiburgense]|uniref:2-C-methyl-D-erythritol 4-phosphate cytidylyltransferase n=1 Tax=Corynebacterium freiburgense TaxID=556548 RepID=UPI0003FE036B|nr:2-C-methyl-D-erythritol 4-phosphate cytidylyltransferase [Corynebacterium freiburgense]WJZ03653.1 2-C-methyl-D-erythritol 4-phosphate cytidylyltransferase [Corynebacterium freiburgense]
MTKSKPVTALVAAAGQGNRLGAGIPKALVEVGGKTLLERSVDGLQAAGVDRIVVVISPPMVPQVQAILEDRVEIVLGGAERMDSVQQGLRHIGEGTVLIHDAARAFTPVDMIQRIIAASLEHKAVIPVLPVTDTVKRVRGEVVVETLERSELRAVQTPQAFDIATLKAAYEARPVGSLATDDASIMEWFGVTVHCVAGDVHALKVTTPLDLVLAKALAKGEQ